MTSTTETALTRIEAKIENILREFRTANAALDLARNQLFEAIQEEQRIKERGAFLFSGKKF